MNLIDDLTRQLDKHNLKLERFKEITSRLLAWGMIVRDEVLHMFKTPLITGHGIKNCFNMTIFHSPVFACCTTTRMNFSACMRRAHRFRAWRMMNSNRSLHCAANSRPILYRPR